MEVGHHSNVNGTLSILVSGVVASIRFLAILILVGNFGALGCSIASEASDEATDADGIRVTMLGTGVPVPNPRQFGQSILVEVGDTKLLFDCGRGCAHRLWNLGHHYLRQTSQLFLTHMHSDHIVGVPDLYMNGWNLGRIENLHVYGPASADTFMHHLRLAFEDDVVFRADKQKHTVTRSTLDYLATEMKDGDSVRIGSTTVTAIAVDHAVIKPALGYRVDAGPYSVVISGDTAYSENLIESSVDADVIIHEVFSPALARFVRNEFPQEVADDIFALHTLAPDVGRVFSQTGPRLGVLTHLDNDPIRLPELIDQVKSNWDGTFVVAQDLMVIEIGDEVRVIQPAVE